jgi:DNA-binding IclR family transcriptional regulator
MILEKLAEYGEECSTVALADELGLAKSQTSRVLKTLTESGYVTRNPKTRKYSINLTILKLSHNLLVGMQQRHVIRQYMQQLVDEFDRPCFSSVPVGLEAIECDVVYPRNTPNPDSLISEIGAVNAPYTTASGKICAAYLAPDKLNELLLRFPPEKNTQHSLIDPEEILKEFEKVKRMGIAESRSELRLGENSMAVPIFDTDGNLTATLGIATPSGDCSEKNMTQFRSTLVSAGQSASFALGYPLKRRKSQK